MLSFESIGFDKLTSLKQAARETYLEKHQANRAARDLLDLIIYPTVKGIIDWLLRWRRSLPGWLEGPFIEQVIRKKGCFTQCWISERALQMNLEIDCG